MLGKISQVIEQAIGERCVISGSFCRLEYSQFRRIIAISLNKTRASPVTKRAGGCEEVRERSLRSHICQGHRDARSCNKRMRRGLKLRPNSCFKIVDLLKLTFKTDEVDHVGTKFRDYTDNLLEFR